MPKGPSLGGYPSISNGVLKVLVITTIKKPSRHLWCISNGVLKTSSEWRSQWSVELLVAGRGVIFAAPKPRERVEPRPKSAAAARARHRFLSIEVSKAL